MTQGRSRYSTAAIALHWAIAGMLAFQLGLGWRMVALPAGSPAFAAYQVHKSIGIVILVLSLARAGLRIGASRPVPVTQGRMSSALAAAVHLGLYGFMIGAPLTGWMIVSTSSLPVPTRLFGAIAWPHLPLPKYWHASAETGHWMLAWIGIALVILHVAGALKHHVGAPARDSVVGRMVPVAVITRSNRHAIGAIAVAAGLLAVAFVAPWWGWTAARTPRVDVAGAGRNAPARSTPASPTATISAPALSASPSPIPAASEAASEAGAMSGPADWRVADGGRLAFVARMNGEPVSGQFKSWTADIKFAPDALEASRIAVRVRLLSAVTGNADRDGVLLGPDFFGEAGTATFRSQHIRLDGPERYRATGVLTMNGMTHPATLSFTLAIAGNVAKVTGTTRIDRTQYGIGRGQWAATDQIAAAVDVQFAFTARRVR